MQTMPEANVETLETPPQATDADRHVSATTKIIGSILGVFGVLGLLAVVVGSCSGVTLFAAAAQPPVTEHATQTLALTGAGIPTITCHLAAGSLQILAGSNNQVGVDITKSVRDISQDQSRRDLATMKVNFTQQGNAITITETYPPSSGWGFLWQGSIQREIDLVITVPAAANLAITAAAADTSITGIAGQITVDSSASRLILHQVTLTGASRLKASAGEMLIDGSMTPDATLDLRDSAGSIDFDGALATHDAITVNASAGSVAMHLPLSTAVHVDANVSAGGISVSGFPLAVRQDFGNASVAGDTAPDPTNTITVHISAGSFTLAGT